MASRYTILEHSLLESMEGLSPAEGMLLILFRTKYWKSKDGTNNNGDLFVSEKEAAAHGISLSTMRRSTKSLLAKGLLYRTRKGGVRSNGTIECSLYGLSFIECQADTPKNHRVSHRHSSTINVSSDAPSECHTDTCENVLVSKPTSPDEIDVIDRTPECHSDTCPSVKMNITECHSDTPLNIHTVSKILSESDQHPSGESRGVAPPAPRPERKKKKNQDQSSKPHKPANYYDNILGGLDPATVLKALDESFKERLLHIGDHDETTH